MGSQSPAMLAIKAEAIAFDLAYRDNHGGAITDFVDWRRAKEHFVADQPGLVEAVVSRIADRSVRLLSDVSKVGSKKRKIKGLGFSDSIDLTCSPQHQCGGCYASDPNAHQTDNQALIKARAINRFVSQDPIRAAVYLLDELRTARGLRKTECVNGAYTIRMFVSGDLTLPTVRMLSAALEQSHAWADLYGRPLVFAVFSRKEYMVSKLIDSVGPNVSRLAINFSLDGSAESRANTERRWGYLQRKNLTHLIRPVQYYRPEDYIFPFAEVTFPHHQTGRHSRAALDTDCWALRDKTIGCLDCGICFTSMAS